ncbi:MAG: ATP-binding protein, partial [Bacteroidota bacterium]
SKIKKHQDVLDASRKNAIKLANEKEQFLANMSHEIRTPMHAISGFAELLLKSDLDKVQKEYIRIISKSTEHLTYILNDVLDFSRLQSGKIKLEEKHFSPHEILIDTIKLLKDKANEKHIQLCFKTDDIPKVVVGDPFRLRQILLNLIYNGIKFTKKGEVNVFASLEKADEDYIQVRFDVKDTGIGIPKDRINHIFNEFEQVNQQDLRKGTGLGLSITKKLVEIHNGEITVTSKENKGSTFSVTLPYLRSKKTKTLTETMDDLPRLSGIKVLIADDEAFNRKLLTAICDEYAITYNETTDGLKTYQILKKEKFDVVLLDFRMPKMNGPEVAGKIRQESGINQNVGIIGLTATVSDQDMKQAKNSGIDRVLRKPFDTNELLQLIHEIMKPRPLSNNTELGNGFTSNPVFDLTGLQKMGDDAFVKDMIETFISSTTQNLTKFQAEFNDENWITCGEILHKIIAPARHLRAENLVNSLKKHEKSACMGNPIELDSNEEIVAKTQKLINSLQLHLQESAKNE